MLYYISSKTITLKKSFLAKRKVKSNGKKRRNYERSNKRKHNPAYAPVQSAYSAWQSVPTGV